MLRCPELRWSWLSGWTSLAGSTRTYSRRVATGPESIPPLEPLATRKSHDVLANLQRYAGCPPEVVGVVEREDGRALQVAVLVNKDLYKFTLLPANSDNSQKWGGCSDVPSCDRAAGRVPSNGEATASWGSTRTSGPLEGHDFALERDGSILEENATKAAAEESKPTNSTRTGCMMYDT